MSTITEVLDLLKKQGVEISAEAGEAAKKRFDGQLLVPSDRVLADGMIAIAKDFNDSKTEDLKVLKEKLRKSEAEQAELKAVLDTGQNTDRKKIEKLLEENTRLKSLADAHLSEKKTAWKTMAEKIPEPMKKFFKFAEEGKDLDDTDIMANVAKLKEYTDIGAIKIEGGPAPDAPHVPPGGGQPRVDTKAWQDLPASEKVKFGYREDAKKGK